MRFILSGGAGRKATGNAAEGSLRPSAAVSALGILRLHGCFAFAKQPFRSGWQCLEARLRNQGIPRRRSG